MMSEQQLKRNSVVCPKCGQRTSFNLIQDAIDEDGEFYCCQHAAGPSITNKATTTTK